MKLYHGTNVEFLEIVLSKSNRYKDFGQGFYLTDIRQQAVELSEKRAVRDGGLDRMTEYLIEDYGLPIAAALQFVYNSDIYRKLSQPENGLYEQSPAYVYEILEREYLTGKAA